MDPREIQSLEELCIQDDAPWCQAACPLHVDARGMLAAISRGDFKAASALYRKKVPFPGILSRVCDEPCDLVCRRREAGGAINIALLERSCAEYAGFAPDRPLMVDPPRTGRVAVVGAGLSGLTAALELAKRRNNVTLFERSDRLGGAILGFPAGVLPPEVIEAEMERLTKERVGIRHRTCLGVDMSLPDLLDEYDAVYVATGALGSAGTHGAAAGAGPAGLGRGLGDIDPLTLATATEGLFAGGGLRPRPGPGGALAYSPVTSMADGRTAAISIDRFIKGESLTSQRENEGPYETRLYTSLEGVEPARPIAVGGPDPGYSADEAIQEAARCLQCQCLECVKACEYLQHFKEYPGACIRKVTKNITSLPGKSYRTHTKFINACSLCGLCGAVCPTDLNMAVVNSEARDNMWERGFMPPAIHESAISDMEASEDDLTLIVRNQPGHGTSAYAFFPGCQLPGSAPANVERAYRYLADTLPGGVGLMLGCCGAPASWSGRQPLFEEKCAVLTAQWESLGRPLMILACPTCSLVFAESLPDIPTVSLWEVLDQKGLPNDVPPGAGAVLAVHDSCTARAATPVQDAVRSLARKLGYEVEELRYNRGLTKCCSYGGLMHLVNPAVGGEVVEARIGESPSDYLTYCSNCRDLFAEDGKASYHVLDLIFGTFESGAARPGPTLSERRDNRRRLAARMLVDLWGETVPAPPEYMSVKVRIPAVVAARMERDRILVEDVQQVIHSAETGGGKLVMPETGTSIAHRRLGLVTYWVEYSPAGEEFEVCNAYSHRMQIVDDPVARDDAHGS